MRRLPDLIDNLIKIVYPDRCACCGRIVGSGKLCGGCEALIKRIPDNCCLKCGLPFQSCECGAGEPAADGFAAPFYNCGRAQRGIYRLKFHSAERAADFFGAAMADCFKERFPGVVPDGICFVPMDRVSKRKRGFNQAERLARVVADKLYVPVIPEAIRKTRRCEPQHTLSREKRIRNVKGAFAGDGPVAGKTLIIIDDIRTTGATINECARALKAAGAEKVFGLCAVRSLSIF